jgi:alginate O-acetyltransferase complex protein AlgI
MSFNSLEFAIFLPIVFFIYWFFLKQNYRFQNLFILVVSYLFYGWWDWRFLILIFLSSTVDYTVGLLLDRTDKKQPRIFLLATSLFFNLGMLGFFKYYNFFIEAFIDSFSFFGLSLHPSSLNIILPVGISFYTFQTLSYTIDIYRKKIKSSKDIISFFAFVSFFPQLVAGPIERAKNLLPQFERKRVFNYNKASDGLKQILWGLFKKMVIADGCAVYVDNIFANFADYSGGILFLGATLFAFQIYADFSGYSDIAIGVAKLLGFDLMRNFNYPYFSKNIKEFWRRWHISLSSWFRDYVYFPLGGSYEGKFKKFRNIIITFTVSGLWHGANWTFVIWGLIHGIYYSLSDLIDGLDKNEKTIIPRRVISFVQILFTFFITVIAWIFFRAESMSAAFGYIKSMIVGIYSEPVLTELVIYFSIKGKVFFYVLCAFVVIEWIQRKKKHVLTLNKVPVIIRWSIYIIILMFTLYTYDYHNPNEFIYFQF